MHHYLARRLAFLVLTVLAASALAFVLLHAVPGGSAETIARHTLVGLDEEVSTEMITEVSAQYNLVDPLWRQYLTWLIAAVTRGDLGTSFVYNEPVRDLVALALLPTLVLASTSMLIVCVVGISLGIYSAVRENRPGDLLVRCATALSISFPSFWIALILMLVFSLTLNWLPVTGYGTPANLVLPAVALALHPTAVVIRVVRTSMLETLGQPFVSYAIAKGLSFRRIVWHHAVRNALIPVVTVIGVYFGHLLAGTVIIENIFAWPGIGHLLVDGVFSHDIPIVTSCIVVIITMFLFVNLSVDLLYHAIDPRIRYE
jgi:peptide/nickel transport system permease protein